MSGLNNALTQSTKTTIPLWQAPLPFSLIPAPCAGQISALGALGMIYIGTHTTCDELQNDIQAYCEYHEQPAFCFYHPLPYCQSVELHYDHYQHLFAQCELEPSAIAQPDSFSSLLDTAIEAAPRLIGFAQGLPCKADLQKIKAASIQTFAICHSVAEAVVAQDYGMDMIVLQGHEAGGIHSRFPNDLAYQPQSANTLLNQVREYIDCPIIVWGDFPSGRDIIAAMIGGADAIMVDRPLLSCQDIPLSDEQRLALEKTNETQSIISDQFTSLPMRLLPNYLTDRLHSEYIHRETVLHTILSDKPEWRPLPVSATICKNHDTIAACIEAYRTDMNAHLA